MMEGSLYDLRITSLPQKYHKFVSSKNYCFRAITKNEILSGLPNDLTHMGWKGIPLTTVHDDLGHHHMGAKMLLAIRFNDQKNQNDASVIAYLRWEFGYINFADITKRTIPAALSHMTTVHPEVRDLGLGTIMKYFLFQVAREVSGRVVKNFTWTYDPLQGRNSRVNLSHLGAICGAAGGLFEENAYGQTGAEQHQGNPTDRFHVVLNPSSAWARAHFQDLVVHPSPDQVQEIPQTIETEYDYQVGNKILTPAKINLSLKDQIITIPIPYDWDSFLKEDKELGNGLVIKWRAAFRNVCNNYFRRGYTAISCVSDKNQCQNYLVLFKDFHPEFSMPQWLSAEPK